MRQLAPWLGLVFLALSIDPQPMAGCATAPREREQVDIVAEQALIVFNPQTHTEHFIRRAHFNTQAKDSGFMVPTPNGTVAVRGRAVGLRQGGEIVKFPTELRALL